jgi:hypothetical protein
MTWCSGSFPGGCISIQITVTLEYEWLLARCYHLVVCLVVLDGLEDGYGYVYHDVYCIYFNYLDDAFFMHVIVYRCKPYTWLN